MQTAFSESGNSPPIYYNYIYLREDGTPRYVGKGCNGRAWKNHKGHLPPKNTELILTQYFESEADAFFAEEFLISYYGRKDLGTGCLRNRTDGGEGPKGYIFTEEHCRNISKAKRGHVTSSKARAKMSISQTGRVHSTESRTRMSLAHLGKKNSEEHRKHLSESLKGKKFSPEHLKNLRVALSKKPPHTAVVRKRISESVKATWTKRKAQISGDK